MSKGFPKGRDLAKEEKGRESKNAPRGSAGKVWNGGGFEEGTHGLGPTPYHRSHSAKPNGHSLEKHNATSGRGADGIYGKGDGVKGRTPDIQHPSSHAEFEALGVDD